MINEWKSHLEQAGFEKVDRRAFARLSPPVSHWVYETPQGVGERSVRVNLAIQVTDPFVQDRPYEAVHLVGDLTRDEIVVWYDSSPCWLSPTQKPAAFCAFERCFVEWFRYWSEMRRLIRYFEHPVNVVRTRPASVPSGVEHIRGNPVNRPRRIPAWDHVLSLLYYHTCNHERSLWYAKRWLTFVQRSIVLTGEPERTLRQMKTLTAHLAS